jgi:cell division protein ZapA (FtsZ GTPase activity inhibitor)
MCQLTNLETLYLKRRMALIDLKIGTISIQLDVDDKDRILNLSKMIEDQITELRSNFKNINDVKALAIIALMLQDKILGFSEKNYHDTDSMIDNKIIYSIISRIEDLNDKLSNILG